MEEGAKGRAEGSVRGWSGVIPAWEGESFMIVISSTNVNSKAEQNRGGGQGGMSRRLMMVGLLGQLKPNNSKRENIMGVGKLQERSLKVPFTDEDIYMFTGYGLLYGFYQEEAARQSSSSEEESAKEKEARKRKKNLECNKRRRGKKKPATPKSYGTGSKKQVEKLKLTDKEIPGL